ncbi:MAG: phosphatase PAP2 family protein [Spirochaetia bacterium]|jgi:undecaprenyl-diphosphatase|nr:phosphatase PAP2 family protein [Spirochaetia bacterium]
MKQTRKLGKLLILLLLLGLVASPLFAENSFDEQFIFPYNETISLASDITSALSMLAPATFAFAAPSSDWAELGLTYGVTTLASYGVRTVLKETIQRPRPYQVPGHIDTRPDSSDWNQSFPSGHTLMAFSSAAYTQTVFSLKYPDSPYRTAVTATTWALAATTAVLRVASGNHFVTDVLAGAAIGSVLGFAGPYLTHLMFKDKDNAPTLMIGPSVGLQVSL